MEFHKIILNFITGLLKKANCNHAGNCLLMSEILQQYLIIFCAVKTKIINCKVKQNRKLINHYCLKMNNGEIIDATASQFINPDGKKMPKVYIGKIPNFYKKTKYLK